MNKAEKIKRQLEQLLAQDLSGMGFQARVRQQQRIEELRALCAEAQSERRDQPHGSTPPDVSAEHTTQ